MDREAILVRLSSIAEPALQAFNQRILPGVPGILGVRTGSVRALAKEIAKGDWRGFLRQSQPHFYEEFLLHGMVIGGAKADPSEILEWTAGFVPLIDNWAVCDIFCGDLKLAKREPELVWAFLMPYLRSERPFEVRFAVVMLLNHYTDERHIGAVLEILDGLSHPHYYVMMAVAWAVSICYIKCPEPTLSMLRRSRLDDVTYNKALSKICESRAVSAEAKAEIRRMKRSSR